MMKFVHVIVGFVFKRYLATRPTSSTSPSVAGDGGGIDDVLELCVQNMRAGVKSQTFDIPRWLTLEEFRAVRRKMLEQGWEVKYTFPSRFRDRPQLCIVPIDDWNEN